MSRVRTLPVVMAVVAAIVIVIVMMLFEVRLPQLSSDEVSVTQSDPLLANHENLTRVSGDYRARLQSLNAFLEEGLVKRSATRAEDIVISSTARLLREHSTAAAASKIAAANMSTAAGELSSQASRVGIDLGPRISPALVKARIRDPEFRSKFAQQVFTFQTAACVNELLNAMQPPTEP